MQRPTSLAQPADAFPTARDWAGRRGYGKLAQVDVDSFAALLTPVGRAAVAAAVEGLDAGAETIGLSTRVRREFRLEPDIAAAVLTQATLRRRGRAKFGSAADQLWFTPDGLEQSTRATIANHRADRFLEFAAGRAGPTAIADLCCGIGADLLAMSHGIARLTGVDRDPLTVAVARANVAEAPHRPADVEVDCADAESTDLARFDAAFIDPSRRKDGRRTFDVRAYSPAWSFVTSVLGALPSAAKLAPGIPHDLVPRGIEIEWVSDGGDLKEAVLWSPALATPGVRRRATVLSQAGTASLVSSSDADPPTEVAAPKRYLYEADPAVVRAHLIGVLADRLEASLLDPTTAYLSSDTLVATPFARAFEITEAMPFSVKKLRDLLRERSVGAVTIMKRGSAVDVEQLRRDLRLKGADSAVVVLALVAGRHQVLIGQSVARPA